MRKAVWIGIGLVAWLAAQAIALGMTGAGHGTYPPLIFSLSLMLLYPAAFMHVFVPGQHKGHRRRQVLAAALLLDVMLLGGILMEGSSFLRVWKSEPAFVTAWIALWLGWQGLFLLPVHTAHHSRGASHAHDTSRQRA